MHGNIRLHHGYGIASTRSVRNNCHLAIPNNAIRAHYIVGTTNV